MSTTTNQTIAQGVGNVIITLGAQGAYALVDDAAVDSSPSGGGQRRRRGGERRRRELRQACPVKEVVDTTGAGDAFGAGVLYSLLGQLALAAGAEADLAFDWEAALQWGCAAGAHAVTKVGASAPPTGREEIEANLSSMTKAIS
jgi:sugar/nucleoside kinase (ribokinase family)